MYRYVYIYIHIYIYIYILFLFFCFLGRGPTLGPQSALVGSVMPSTPARNTSSTVAAHQELLPWQVACDHGWEIVDAELSAAEPGHEIIVKYRGEEYVYSFESEVKGSQLNVRTEKRRPLRRLVSQHHAPTGEEALPRVSTRFFISADKCKEQRRRMAGLDSGADGFEPQLLSMHVERSGSTAPRPLLSSPKPCHPEQVSSPSKAPPQRPVCWRHVKPPHKGATQQLIELLSPSHIEEVASQVNARADERPQLSRSAWQHHASADEIRPSATADEGRAPHVSTSFCISAPPLGRTGWHRRRMAGLEGRANDFKPQRLSHSELRTAEPLFKESQTSSYTQQPSISELNTERIWESSGQECHGQTEQHSKRTNAFVGSSADEHPRRSSSSTHTSRFDNRLPKEESWKSYPRQYRPCEDAAYANRSSSSASDSQPGGESSMLWWSKDWDGSELPATNDPLHIYTLICFCVCLCIFMYRS